MATLNTRLQDLAQRAGTENKALRALINGNLTDLSSMSTTTKTSLVAAINEIMGRLADIQAAAGAAINDGSDSSSTQTWSINKITSQINTTAATVKAEILGGAGPAYDTLQELKDLLDNTDSDIATFTTALGNRVRVDTAAQGLSEVQKTNARTNIGAQAASEIGNTDQNLVAIFEAALV